MAESIVSSLGSVLNDPLVSVEILPGSGDEWLPDDIPPHKRFVLAEGNLGVPQKFLLKAFSVSVVAFQRDRVLLRSQTPRMHLVTIDTGLSTNLLHASAILVLLNPGHQTAWNVRKELVSLGTRDVHRERELTTALLTVRECAKHSLLWHHRRWLLRTIHSEHTDASSSSRADTIVPNQYWFDADDEDSLRRTYIPVTAFREEFAVCTLACETYERNYFAWMHRFRCLDALATSIHRTALSIGRTGLAELDTLLQDEHAQSSKWIDQHVSDYSAMQYHCFVDLVLKRRAQLLPESPFPRTLGTMSPVHAKSLVESYPSHEALWLYLRSSAILSGAEERPDAAATLEAFARSHLPEDQRSARFIRRTPLTLQGSPTVVESHAGRLLAWLGWFGPLDGPPQV